MDITSLFEIAEEVTSSTDLDTVLHKIGMVSKKLLNCEASSIMLLDESRKSLYFKVATGEKGRAVQKFVVPVGVGVAGWVAKNLRPVIIEDTTKDPRFTGQFDKTSGFITKSLICVAIFSKGEPIGVMEVLNKIEGKFTQADLGLLTHLAGLASVAISNAQLVQQQRNFFAHGLEILALAIEALGPAYVGHPWRSQRLAVTLARRLELSHSEISDLTHASLLHDIGALGERNPRYLESLGLSRSAYDGEGGLHAVVGESMLSGVEIFKGVRTLVRHHHEHFDGSGGPDHLSGKDIPIGARILALVEVVEDLRHQMRQAPPEDIRAQMMTEINNLSGKKLDPAVCRAFLENLQEEELV